MVAMGGRLPTVTLTVAEALWLVLLVTVNVAVNVWTVADA